jgi:hypothetical protein
MARARCIAKWTGVILTAVALVAYPVSLRCRIEVGGYQCGWAVLGHGQIWVVRSGISGRSGFRTERNDQPIGWGFDFYTEPGGVWWVHIPLWSLALAAAIPTALLWRADRRAKPVGCCSACGYSLAGLPAGQPCPECGGGGTSA